MTFEELKDKALSLPYEPGVYLMQDKTGTVIYVGTAKKLKNRVSQYFQDTASHTPKTRKMVSQIDHFDTIVARSEFEALVLECSLIKRHMPKYNILLKDDKGYPYLRVDLAEDYPTMQMVSRITGDKASYFGPFGGRFVTQHVIDTLRLTLKLPGCSKQFPRDLGKERPCLNYHMNNCDGWCQLSRSQKDYHARMEQAVLILQGNYKQVAGELRAQMEAAADKLQFELAASLRDRLRAVESLGEKQLVTAGTMANTDVIGYYQNETRACFAVLHYVNGSLLDKEYEILATADDPKEAVSSLVKQFYLVRGAAHCTFVDKGREPIAVIRENLKKTRLEERATVVQADYSSWLKTCRQQYDLILLDPPYAEVFLETALKIVSEIDILTNSGIIVCERPFDKTLPEQIPGLVRYRDYRYGKAAVTIFRRG